MALTGITAALRSRLESGLTIPLSPPRVETRFAVLRALAEEREFSVPGTVLHALAEGLDSTVGGLRGALVQVEALARLQRRPVDMVLAREYLADRNRPRVPSIGEIAAAAAEFFQLTLADLRSSSRRRAMVTARGVAVFLARRLAHRSFQEIGDYFGGRDHTTILHAYRKTEDLLRADPVVQHAVERIRQKWEAS
jgi:chromosomal replication initiator protein